MATKKNLSRDERRAARQKQRAAAKKLTKAQAELYQDVLDGMEEAAPLFADLADLADAGLGLPSQFATGIIKSARHIKSMAPKAEAPKAKPATSKK